MGPHHSERLSHRTEVLFHRALTNFFSVECVFSGAYSMRKDLKKRDGIFDSFKSGGETQRAAKCRPDAPMGTHFSPCTGNDPAVDCVPASIEISEASLAYGRGTKVQDFFWGKVASK